MEGWLKIHRSILEWEWYGDANVKILFFHCLLRANHKPSRWKGNNIETGSFITSYPGLSKETGLTVRQVRYALVKLEKTNELTVKRTNKFSVVSLTNWSKYQVREEKVAVKCQSNGSQVAPDKNERNVRNKVYTPEFLEFWTLKASGGKADAFDVFNRRIKEGYTPDIMLKAWERYLMDCHKRNQDKIKYLSTFLNLAGDTPRFMEWIEDDSEGSERSYSINECKENELYPMLPEMKEIIMSRKPTLLTGNQGRLLYTMLIKGCPPDDYFNFKALVQESNSKLTKRPPDRWVINSQYSGTLTQKEFNL